VVKIIEEYTTHKKKAGREVPKGTRETLIRGDNKNV